MAEYTQTETHIEVHKFRVWAVVAVAATALLLQSFIPVYFPSLRILELPLLIATLFWISSQRNPSSGLLMGMLIGLVQDSLGSSAIGLYGIAKTVTGFLASSFGSRIDVDNPLSRFGLTAAFFVIHQGTYILTRRLLLGESQVFFHVASGDCGWR